MIGGGQDPTEEDVLDQQRQRPLNRRVVVLAGLHQVDQPQESVVFRVGGTLRFVLDVPGVATRVRRQVTHLDARERGVEAR